MFLCRTKEIIQFTLCTDNSFERTKSFKMSLTHIGDNTEIWLYDINKSLNLTRVICAHLYNCDLMPLAPETRVVQLGPVKAFLTHGHLYSVSRWQADSLVYAAQEQGAQIAMFGHTHSPVNDTLGGVTLINPGTAGKGRDLTWALVTVFDNGAVSCEIREL